MSRSAIIGRVLLASLISITAVSGCQTEASPDSSRRAPGSLPQREFALAMRQTLEPPPPEEALAGPLDLAVAGGHVWILDGVTHLVHRYAADGRHERSFGTKGRGPGELLGPTALGMAGDSVWVLSASNRRIEFFSREGEPRGSRSLPEGTAGLYHLRSAGDEFIGTVTTGDRPLIRFAKNGADDAERKPTRFGEELAAAARRCVPSTADVPHVYRLALPGDGRIWAIHVYCPLLGIYSAAGELIRIVTYSENRPGSGRIETRTEDGQTTRTLTAPANPAGSVSLLRASDTLLYLVSHQREEDGTQRLFALTPAGEVAGRSPSPVDGLLGVGAPDPTSDASFAVAALGELEVPGVLRLEPAGDRAKP